MSTVDSVGPRTPPLVKGKAKSSSPSKYSSLPAFLSTVTFDDLASYLDFSAT